MEKIARIIIEYKSFITFFVCLLLSVFLIFSNQSPQIHTLRTILVDISGTIISPFNYFFELFSAVEENKRLKTENMKLNFENSLLRKKDQEVTRLRQLLQLKERSMFRIKAGSIIAWGEVPSPNTITINLGTTDGIHKNDPVISSRGLVGKVFDAGREYAVCQLLTARNFKVSAVLLQTGAYGLLQWKKDNIAAMEVLKSASVVVGDTVVTSEHGNIYPEGIPIGIVESYYDGSELFKIVNVKLLVNYLALHDIAVIIDDDPPPEGDDSLKR